MARDSNGLIRGSGAGALKHVAMAIQAEAHACTETAQAAAEWGMGKIHFETDSQTLVRALLSTELDLAPEGVIYRDLRVYLRLHFNSFQTSHVSRDCNKLAHALAALRASRQAQRHLWPEAVPDELPVSVTSDPAESGI